MGRRLHRESERPGRKLLDGAHEDGGDERAAAAAVAPATTTARGGDRRIGGEHDDGAGEGRHLEGRAGRPSDKAHEVDEGSRAGTDRYSRDGVDEDGSRGVALTGEVRDVPDNSEKGLSIPLPSPSEEGNQGTGDKYRGLLEVGRRLMVRMKRKRMELLPHGEGYVEFLDAWGSSPVSLGRARIMFLLLPTTVILYVCVSLGHRSVEVERR